MTTLAIIGSGILGRSLLYTLAKEQKSFEKITLFNSDSFAFPCSLHSTAIVAPRGLSQGHSPLGDLLLEAYAGFKQHIELDNPEGVELVTQFTGASDKLDAFRARYPHGGMLDSLSSVPLKKTVYIASEEAYLIDPKSYNDWLLSEARMMEQYHLEVINDFVTELEQNDRVHLKTQQERVLSFDKVIFTGGNYNRFWKGLIPDSKLKTSKAVQGSYLEFNSLPWDLPSFSLTFDGDNLIWNNRLKRLLIGSTTSATHHLLPPLSELTLIYQRLSELVDLTLPDLSQAEIKVGLREKAQKREPYTIREGDVYLMGGMYKNGYSLALKMSKNFSHQYL